MAKNKTGLGRGLSALLPEEDFTELQATDTDEHKQVLAVAPSNIAANPWQPRRTFDEEALQDLTASIRTHGILSPLIVTRLDEEQYRLVSGERRLRAAQRAGLTTVPVIVRDFTDDEVAQLALIENVQRDDLSALEEAQGYRQLMEDYGHTAKAVADLVGKSRSYVANLVRLLQLPEPVQQLLDEKHLTAGHARALLALDAPDMQTDIATDIVQRGLSVRAVEQLVQDIKAPLLPEASEKAPDASRRNAYSDDATFKAVSDQLTAQLQTRVRIRHSGKNGRLEIDFYGADDLQRILDTLQIETY